MKKNVSLSIGLILMLPSILFAQSTTDTSPGAALTSPGILGTIILLAIVIMVAVIIIAAKISSYTETLKKKRHKEAKLDFQEDLINLTEEEVDAILEKRKQAIKYKLKGNELGSDKLANDKKGLIAKLSNEPENPLVDEKKKVPNKHRNS